MKFIADKLFYNKFRYKLTMKNQLAAVLLRHHSVHGVMFQNFCNTISGVDTAHGNKSKLWRNIKSAIEPRYANHWLLKDLGSRLSHISYSELECMVHDLINLGKFLNDSNDEFRTRHEWNTFSLYSNNHTELMQLYNNLSIHSLHELWVAPADINANEIKHSFANDYEYKVTFCPSNNSDRSIYNFVETHMGTKNIKMNN